MASETVRCGDGRVLRIVRDLIKPATNAPPTRLEWAISYYLDDEPITHDEAQKILDDISA